MKFTTNFIPYIAFQLGFLPTALALVEPEPSAQTPVSLASFADIAPADTDFLSATDVPSFTSRPLVENLGVEASSIKVDGRSGKPVSLDLKHPILPGDGVGNALLWSVGGGHGSPGTPEEWGDIGVKAVKNWITDHQTDLQIDASELFPKSNNLFDTAPSSLSNIRHAVHGEDGDTIQISMRRLFKNVPVVGSRATATIKRGNLVNVGLEMWGDIDERFNVQPRISEEEAYEAVAIKTGLVLTEEITCKPELQIITTSQGELYASSLRSKFTPTYDHTLVWKVCPKFQGQAVEKMEALVDAMTGQVLSFEDTVDYLQAVGDVFPFSNDKIDARGSLQDGWPMPFMEVGSATTDSGGNYALVGSQTARLTGPYVEMRDLCGSGYTSGHSTPRTYGIAELTQSNGIDWGGMSVSTGTDCSTPGVGTAANTHSSRSGFYELNRIIEIARSRLPSNAWLQSRLESYMNINSSCNAYFDGNVNFYRSSSQCANTGELAGVFVHEWGHGMDYYDVATGIANPSGEGIADIYTALRLHDSCIGRGFFKSGVCSGNGNPCLQCNGVRDIDYKKRQSQQPSTFTWSNNNCGGGVHCMGYVYSEAVWSLYARELPAKYGYDDNTSLEIVTRLTYIAAGNIQTWFSGSPPFGGCGTNSGYFSFLAADDDNGNLNDGTPHMEAIYKAFNDQEIACNTLTVQDSGCAGTPTDSPVVTITGLNSKAVIEWTAVSGASKYQIFRTEGLEQCEQGKVKIATLNSNVLTYTDENIANGREYSYIVIPIGPAESCFGPSSACTTVTPAEGPDLNLVCDNEPLAILMDPNETPSTETRTCAVSGLGGFTGSVNIGCSSSVTGVSCSTTPTTVSVSSNPTDVILSIVPTSAASGSGTITVTASGGSLSSNSVIPVSVLTAGEAQTAEFDNVYKAPRCALYGSECSSGDLLVGRGAITGGNEANAPNTVGNSCSDGGAGTYGEDESIDRIVVRSGFENGDGAGAVMAPGERATITATVHAWGTGGSDRADFYYATDDNTSWTFIATKTPATGGFSDISVSYDLPQAKIHRVRVNFRYGGSASSCSSGSWDDHDDLVFAVADGSTSAPVSSSPSKNPTPSPTPSPTISPSSSPSFSPSTAEPSNSPSTKPTLSPTTSPSSSPSLSPSTVEPTSNPTSTPSVAPTKSPSQSPSNSPSTKPTLSPTSSPSSSPSLSPSTLEPTSSPSTSPSVSPSDSPSKSPSKSPTSKPTSPPTPSPSAGPTSSPSTLSPTAQPVVGATPSPTSASPTSASPTSASPTSAPTSASPTSSSPTSANPTSLPTSANPTPAPTSASPTSTSPTSASPTSAPTSASPTSASPVSASPVSASPVATPSGNGPQDASFDSSFGAPKCGSAGSSCSSGILLNGRNNIYGGAEPNTPNTLDSCQDGSAGSYHSDESIDKVVVRSGDIDETSDADMVEGGRATIVASVWAWGSGASDTADFYYAVDASNPSWQYIGSKTPEGGGAQEIKMAYNLPQGSVQAVRVQFRYGGVVGYCTSGSWNDRDDLVFTVSGGTKKPTQSPVSTPPPTNPPGGGPQQASYDASLTIPRCIAYGSSCDSLGLLNGRGSMRYGNEPNRPNTLNSCADGNSGTYHSDESADKIVVRSGEVDGTGSGVDMVEGGRATIEATVWAWSTGTSDYADFYYAADASNPEWKYIGTKQPGGGGLRVIKMAYNLPQGTNQAVRVSFRYRGVQGSNGACSGGYYDDNDDLAFGVKASSSFNAQDIISVEVDEVPKNLEEDSSKRTEITAGKRRKRVSKAAKNSKRA